MNRQLFFASVLAVTLTGAAYAQTPTAPPARSMVPAEKMETSPRATPAMPNAQIPGSATMSNMSNWRASKIIGTAVYNPANERIGEVNELLLDNTGKVAHVVLGVGGFLGLGEREVAVPFSDLKMSMDGSTARINTTFTRQSLTSMPEWKWDTTSRPIR